MASIPSALRRALRELPGPAVLIVLVLAIMHRCLFSGGKLVPSWPDTDLFAVYMPWRYFGFSQWSQGHFPYWNPHIFCGNPFFAQIQSCLLYPIAWVNFFFNTATATTLEMALDLAVAGICTYAWARHRGISRCGATLAGAVFTFSGAVYPHVIDGYISVLASAAWMPLVFLAIDRLLAKRFRSGVLIGAPAICLQYLGGQAQLVYYTFLIGGVYLLLYSINRPAKIRLYIAFTVMCLLGTFLAGAQLVPCYLATQLSIRAGGTSYRFASMVSLAPESLLSMLIPYPLGNIATVPYLGRWYLWEMSLYAGIVAFVLACIGIAGHSRASRWRWLALLGFILLLALGKNTPLHWVLYKYLPGFALFRGPSKFVILWALLLAVLAGEGWDRLRRGEISRRWAWLAACGAGAGILLAVIAGEFNSPQGPVDQLLAFIFKTSEFGAAVKDYSDPHILRAMPGWMAWQWAICAALLIAASVLIFLRRWFFKPVYFLLLLAIADVYFSAADSNAVAALQQPFPRQWIAPLGNAIQADQRVVFTNGVSYANLGNMLGFDDIWGYDTGQPKRFTELIAASQGQHPSSADQYIFQIQKIPRIFQLLRCRYILQWNSEYPVIQERHPMPRLQLIGSAVVLSDFTAIADRLNGDFDFRHAAILPAPPTPAPTSAGATGTVKLLRQSINDLEISADLPAPALLLITDAYAPGWRVRSMERNAAQNDYEVLNADAVLRAIPLAAGHHHFDLYYTAPGLTAGITLSALAGGVWLAGIATLLIRHRRASSRSA